MVRESAAASERVSTPLPAGVDLRPRLLELGLTPRAQGARGTCSIFTTCEAIEFAIAVQCAQNPADRRGPNDPKEREPSPRERDARTPNAQPERGATHQEAKSVGKSQALRLSPEYLNWAAGQANGHPSDGNFFHNALAGFERFGLCSESTMPYHDAFDAAVAPSVEAASEAERIRQQSRGVIVVHWIVPWVPDRFGVSAEQFAEIKRVLALGYPVAAGSGHSRLLVGYRDDPALPGGGAFRTEDSALNRFDEVPYEFVVKEVADVFWVEASPSTSESKR